MPGLDPHACQHRIFGSIACEQRQALPGASAGMRRPNVAKVGADASQARVVWRADALWFSALGNIQTPSGLAEALKSPSQPGSPRNIRR